ncbi:TolC family protein [Saprospira grandis]|uniref:TolC family protein n=1 Tax=Saprospira grandis TaxID=1008 RepID=UPI00059B815B|nr:TolC family protein [Saprospira grandis]
MSLKSFFLAAALLLLLFPLRAQDSLSYQSLIENAKLYHPLSRQIQLLEQTAEAELRKARGGLDPKLMAKWDQKQFKSKEYYDIFESYLQLPSIWGINLQAGYRLAEGYYLNPADQLPAAGQAFLGVEVPILNGLIQNERRNAIRQAKLLQSQNQAEQLAQINQLLYDISADYWGWSYKQACLAVYEENREIQATQLSQLRDRFLQGDIAAIDTLKGFIQWQDAGLKQLEARLASEQAALKVERHLWGEELEEKSLPLGSLAQSILALPLTPLDSSDLEGLLARLEQQPELQSYAFQQQGLELEERLKANKLLPKIKLKYNFLAGESLQFGQGSPLEYYKLGVQLEHPILMRSARGDLALNRLKQQKLDFKYRFKQRDLQTKLKSYFMALQQAVEQAQLADELVENYRRLVVAEREKFMLGESDIFIVNTRQQQYVEAQLKALKLRYNYIKSRIAWQWASNW